MRGIKKSKGMAIGHCIGVLGKEAISMISVDISIVLIWCGAGWSARFDFDIGRHTISFWVPGEFL